MDSEETSAESSAVAQSLRQATQLLLQAVERLGPTTAATSAATPATAATAATSLPSRGEFNSFYRSNSLFRPSRQRLRRRRPYEAAVKRWIHTFVCLVQVGQYLPPDTAGRVRLVQAGLGEKRVMCDFDAGADELHEALLSTFPRLKMGGGYECMKIDESSWKSLTVVLPPTGVYTPFYLKNIFHQAKIFVRPLQVNLDLTPVDDVSSQIS